MAPVCGVDIVNSANEDSRLVIGLVAGVVLVVLVEVVDGVIEMSINWPVAGIVVLSRARGTPGDSAEDAADEDISCSNLFSFSLSIDLT